MKKKVKEALSLKEEQLLEVNRLYDKFGKGEVIGVTLSDLDKNKVEIEAQISILRHLLFN